jgi:hypothetical protein
LERLKEKFKNSNKANNENQRIIRKERQIVKLFLINFLLFIMENAMSKRNTRIFKSDDLSKNKY